jgi:acyl-[acyl-carrier-protein]-phospholipid O-acyltransferase/long-chain-fatty-acid--[acyl-carrier-protein] ligase
MLELLSTRRFLPLFAAQFLAAFNDNFLKNALVALIVYSAATSGGGALVQLAGALFIAPFFFLSGVAGEIADSHDKAIVARRIKLGELGATAIGAAGFALHSIPVMMGALALFGVLAALFSPVKYGLLPDLLRTSELPAGNALVEGATFLAILFGTTAGTKAATDAGAPWIVSVILVAIAVACWAATLFIPPTGARAPDLEVDRNVVRSTWRLIMETRRDRRIWTTTLVANWFWGFGAVVLSLLPTLTRDRLGGDENLYIAFLTLFSVSIAIGSALAAWLARGRILLLPTPIAGLLMALFAFDAGFATPGAAPAHAGLFAFFLSFSGLRLAFDFFMMAVGGGVFIVPAFAAIQAWAGEDRRARVVAANSVVSAAYIVLSALVAAGLQFLGLNEGRILIVLACVGVAVSIAAFRFLRFDPMADALSIIFRTLYRMEVRGAENFTRAGANPILAPNHTSFLDAALVMSLSDLKPVFAIDENISKLWWVRPLLGLVRAFPLDPTKPMAIRSLVQIVQRGLPLVIFPEGRLTVTGSLMKVYDGAGLIAEKTGAMIVPIRIEGLEQTPFSRLRPDQTRRKWWPKVTVTVLEPEPLALPEHLRGRQRRRAAGDALYGIMSDLIFRTTPTDKTIIEAVIDAAGKQGEKRVAIADPVSGELTYKTLVTGAAVLGRKFLDLDPEGAVGLMLPSSNGAAVAMLGLMSAGRTPAMINFTAGAAAIVLACKAAEVRTLVTSRLFVEKAKLGPVIDAVTPIARIVYLEDVRATVTLSDKLRGALGRNRPLIERQPSDPAVILFTSGSEGAPKGVVLSHRNILSNAAQAAARIDFGRSDTVFNVLPVFHSFGLTVGLTLPLVFGVRTYQYPSPLHYRLVPELIYGVNATIMFGTDTFLAGYARTANPYDFRSLRYVLAGAEPVKDATRRVYAEKFGLRILEGYGLTETAPAIALNTPMHNRFGTVGRILPGMEARIEPVEGVAGAGRLFVKGPNVMSGYVRVENPGVIEAPEDGWHDTGDIVSIDADGFIAIRGRAKRFAKVGGEMISLAAVEALAAELWPDAPSAVVTTPDPRKGERLILATQRADATRAAFQSYAKSKGASDMMAPAEIVVVDRLPLLGSGKVDYRALSAVIETREAA